MNVTHSKIWFFIVLIFLTLFALLVFNTQGKSTQTESFKIDGKIFTFSVNSVKGEIDTGDADSTFGYSLNGFSVGGIIEHIPDEDLELEMESWLNLYNVSYEFSIGLEAKSDEFLILGAVNGVTLYRKIATDNNTLRLYGEIEDGVLSPIFIDNLGYKWNFIYSSLDGEDFSEGQEELYILDSFFSGIRVE